MLVTWPSQVTWRRAGVDLRAEKLLAAVDEGVSPAPAQETGVVGTENSGQDLAADVVGQYPVVIRRGPRRMREMRDPDSRRAPRQQVRRQAQVIILDDRAGGRAAVLRGGRRRIGERGCEHLVVAAERLPVAREAGAETRLTRRVVEHVVHEPQGGVRHGVIGPLEQRRRDIEHPDLGAAAGQAGIDHASRSGLRRHPVAVGQGGADPQHVCTLRYRGQAGHHPAAAAPGGQAAVIAQRKGDWPPVGRDQNSPAGLRFAHKLRA